MGASVADYEYDCCEATATSLAATHLAGFNGELMPFTLCTLPDAETDRLPTSSTCFNKVYLPKPRTAWTSQSSLPGIPKLARLGLAMSLVSLAELEQAVEKVAPDMTSSLSKTHGLP